MALSKEELLEADKFGQNEERQPHARKCAALMLAENPDASLADIAKPLGVDRSTVKKWKRDPDFLDRVEHLKNDYLDRLYHRMLLDNGMPLPDLL